MVVTASLESLLHFERGPVGQVGDDLFMEEPVEKVIYPCFLIVWLFVVLQVDLACPVGLVSKCLPDIICVSSGGHWSSVT